MKKHILALAGLLAGAMMVTSCSQARLDEVEHLGVTEVDKTYAEADDMTAQQLIANVYVTAKYLRMGDWGVHYIATTSAKTAECWPGGSGPNDGTDYHRMSAMIDDSENNAYKEMYTRFYKIMYKCNMIVDKLNDGSDERKRVIAEAKAWRAWAMMRLTQLWGSAPLVDHVLDGINYSFYPGNSNPADNWKWIMTQFDEAATVLPSKSGLGGQKAIGGRWTAEACFAYKGQGYMWQNDYANAKVELAKVINSGKYELWEKTATMGPSSYGTNMQLAKSQNENWSDGNEEYEYLTLYRAEADFCDEFLLELDIDGDATTITSTEPYWFRAYMNWRKDEVNLPGNTTTASDGWGFVNPTRTFGYAFAKHDGNSVRRRAAIATYSEGVPRLPLPEQGRARRHVEHVVRERGLFPHEILRLCGRRGSRAFRKRPDQRQPDELPADALCRRAAALCRGCLHVGRGYGQYLGPGGAEQGAPPCGPDRRPRAGYG